MFVNQYKINLATLSSGTTATTINIPVTMEYQLVDQAELVDRVFVDTETEKAINPIIDYEKIRFLPIKDNVMIPRITYLVDLLGATTYGAIGFTNEDIIEQREVFKQTFLNLNFYDSDNPMNQILVSNITLYSQLLPTDLVPLNSQNAGIPGQPLPANQISIHYQLESPIFNPLGFSEGYFLYDYKDELNIGESKYLYMRASFKNAKDGKSTNLMVKNVSLPIDELIHQLYTRYKLTRTSSGYYYTIDDTYQGSTGFTSTHNVTYLSNNDVVVNLYQIRAL